MTFAHVIALPHTYTNTCWNRGQGDPEGHPREDNKQAGGDVSLQDEVQDTPLQLKVEDQFRVIAFEKNSVSVLDSKKKHVIRIRNPTCESLPVS